MKRVFINIRNKYNLAETRNLMQIAVLSDFYDNSSIGFVIWVSKLLTLRLANTWNTSMMAKDSIQRKSTEGTHEKKCFF